MYPETEKDGFIEFKAYDPVQKTTFSSSFIKSPAGYSVSKSDINSSVLLQTAQALDSVKDKVRIEALLETAVLDYPNSVFASEIQDLIYPNKSVPLKTQPAYDSLMYTTSDNVNVRDLPDTVLGKVIGQLGSDTLVYCDMETTDSFTINNMTAKWIHITQPFNGWVFGGWLIGK